MGRKPPNIQKGLKTVLTKLIRNISIIAIGLALVLVFLAYAGIRINDFEAILQWKGAVASVALIIANIVLYELWLNNGREDGRVEEHYKTTIETYDHKSKDLDNSVMQQFIDWETKRREKVEENQKNKLLTAIQAIIDNPKTTEKERKKLIKKRDKLEKREIHVDMPYYTAEEFDKLRYSTRDINPKEYKPGDTKKLLTKKRSSKYTMVIIFSLISFNLLGIGFTGDWLGAVIMTIIALVSLLMSIVSGFSLGYRAITITDYGVYRTANEFIDKAKAWATQKKVSLYRKEPEFIFPVDALDQEDYYCPTIEEAFAEDVPKQKTEIIIE